MVGIHYILELYDCPVELLNDVSFVKKALLEASRKARSTLITEVSHQFTPHGVTALGLLAESHISIHTWPEYGYAAADVFTCGNRAEPDKACNHLVRVFRAQNHSLIKVPRGAPSTVVMEPGVGSGLTAEDMGSEDSEEADNQGAVDRGKGMPCRARRYARISG